MRTIMESLTPTVTLSEQKSTLTTGLDKLTDYAVPLYSKSVRTHFLDDLDEDSVTSEKEIREKLLTLPRIDADGIQIHRTPVSVHVCFIQFHFILMDLKAVEM